jgi:soluble lytic murein transglycosylase
LSELELLDPKAYILPGYYLDFARRARLRGDLPGLVQWCLRTLERFPDHPRAAEAYWLLVWEHYRQGLPAESVRWAEAFLANPAAANGRERFHYWLGRAYTQLGRDEDARRAWAPLLAPARTDLYSLLAQGEALERLAMPASVAAEAQPAAPEGPQSRALELSELWSQRPLLRPVFLLMLGEPMLAQAALEQALAAPATPAQLRELAAALIRLRAYHLAQKVAVRHLRPASDPQNSLDPGALRLLYPLAYWEQVNGRAREALDPLFVLAIIREESHFRADADSSAGAKGLMQLMPTTAAALARDHGLPEEEEALLEPNHNIALGMLYLERLAKRFGGNALHIAAGYNAGPTAVAKWLRSMSSLPADEFIESIPYDETQTYVKKVLATSILYRRLYRAK